MRTLLAASGEGHGASARTPRHGTTFSKSWKNAMAADRPPSPADPPTWLLHDSVPTSTKLREQRGFAAA
jgi:hypothetical protein